MLAWYTLTIMLFCIWWFPLLELQEHGAMGRPRFKSPTWSHGKPFGYEFLCFHYWVEYMFDIANLLGISKRTLFRWMEESNFSVRGLYSRLTDGIGCFRNSFKANHASLWLQNDSSSIGHKDTKAKGAVCLNQSELQCIALTQWELYLGWHNLAV